MIITKSEPFTQEEIEKLKEVYQVYIKVVFDIRKNICSAGANRNFESERILLDQGSNKSDLWGGGIDVNTKQIYYNSFINIRTSPPNVSPEIQDPVIKQKFEELIKYFFQEFLRTAPVN